MSDPSTSDSSRTRAAFGPRRAAELMVAIGKTHASEVLTHLPDHQVGRLAWLVAHTDQLDRDQREGVLRDFYASLTDRDDTSVGGPEAVQQMLEAAFGDERAADLQARLGAIGRPKPFKFLEHVSIELLAEFLTAEHPQMIALILVSLDSDFAVELLMRLPPEVQVDSLVRIVSLDAPSPDAVELTESIVQRRLAGAVHAPTDPTQLMGADQLVEVLRHVDAATQRVILEGIGELDPALATAIRQQMFVFDDLVLLDSRSLQRVLRDVDQGDLTLSMRAADDDVREVIFQNMSSRAAAMVRDDMEAVGPVRLTVVHEAQNRIVTVVRRLQDSEEIVIERGGDDALVA